jgi:capsular polysaccharide transport system permease protein
MTVAAQETQGESWLRKGTSGLRVQFRVLGALIRRELLTRYGRKNIGFAWLFVEPMLFTLAIAVLWSFAKLHTMPGLSIVAFAVTGYSSVLIWRNSASRCARAVQTNWALLYHRQVTPLDILLARILIEIGGATASLTGLATIFTAVGWMEPPVDLLRVMLAWLLLSSFALAFGLLIGAASEISEIFERLWHIAAYILFPVSGAVTMAQWLPESARRVVLILPMVHGVEMLRGGWFGPAVHTYEDPVYMVVITCLIAGFALVLVRQVDRRLEPQ